jgi:hypothetical protein
MAPPIAKYRTGQTPSIVYRGVPPADKRKAFAKNCSVPLTV